MRIRSVVARESTGRWARLLPETFQEPALMLIHGPTAAAISGSSAGMGSIQQQSGKGSSTTCGSLIHPQINGRGRAAAAMAVYTESTGGRERQPPRTFRGDDSPR